MWIVAVSFKLKIPLEWVWVLCGTWRSLLWSLYTLNILSSCLFHSAGSAHTKKEDSHRAAIALGEAWNICSFLLRTLAPVAVLQVAKYQVMLWQNVRVVTVGLEAGFGLFVCSEFWCSIGRVCWFQMETVSTKLNLSDTNIVCCHFSCAAETAIPIRGAAWWVRLSISQVSAIETDVLACGCEMFCPHCPSDASSVSYLTAQGGAVSRWAGRSAVQ